MEDAKHVSNLRTNNLQPGKNTDICCTVTETIVSVIDRQRRDQECMMRALAEGEITEE
jgi:hypothetical protein